MGIMQMEFQEMTLERECEQLVTCQTRCLGLERNVANQQMALQEALIKATKVKKEHLDSIEDIECYHQMLINMKEQYWKDVEVFMKASQQNSNHMHLACILVTSRAMEMGVELVKM